MKNPFKHSKLDQFKAKTKPLRKKLKILKKREFWTKFVVIISTVALLATTVLPYMIR